MADKVTVDTYCQCREDWADGGSICQECKLPRESDDNVTGATFSPQRLRQFARELHNAAHTRQTREPDPYGEALDWSADEIERLRDEKAKMQRVLAYEHCTGCIRELTRCNLCKLAGPYAEIDTV
jgi:hypothetical protein